MADYPCDFHLSRYSGPSNRVYVNVYREDKTLKFKASLCGDCLAEEVTGWLQRALHQLADGSWDPGSETLELEELWCDATGPRDRLNGFRRL